MKDFVTISGLTRNFDVSRPLLNRLIEREKPQILKAVQDVSFSIKKKETFALVGESGSGKSTIAKMVVGLLKPTAGQVEIDGQDITDVRDAAKIKALRARIAMIFQDPYASLNPRWRVVDTIAEPLKAFDIIKDAQEREDEVVRLLKLVGLDGNDRHKYPHEFSGGQRQRIAIARALAARPELIVCDEPTSALDVSVQAQILNLMRDLQDEFGLTYLLISHNLAVVRHMANRIGVLYLGRLVEVNDAKKVFTNPKHPYTKLLLDAVPDLANVGQARKFIEGEIPNAINLPKGCAFHPRCALMQESCSKAVPQLRTIEDALVACDVV
jgi:oligopeptide/dipeptide ABC transporter ATP-binding protein